MLSGIVWASEGIRGKEPMKDSAQYFISMMLVAGVLLIIAAKIAS
mgnify:CR=1 FL=1